MKDTTTTTSTVLINFSRLPASSKRAVLAARKIQDEIRLINAPTEDAADRRKFNRLFKSRDALMPSKLLYGTWVVLVCRPDLCD